jgi:hypothetical protein
VGSTGELDTIDFAWRGEIAIIDHIKFMGFMMNISRRKIKRQKKI